MASAQVGVKRPASGPALVPGDQPGFRGRVLGPADAIKTPRLEAGNLNNRTSNIQVVYTRVVTEDSVTLAAGRLGPGDVCFMRKKKARFYNHAAGTGLQQVCEMLGLDGANRLLCGEMDGSGFVVGVNAIDLDDPATPTPAVVLPTDDENYFKLDILDELTLDGVIVSNESAQSYNAKDVCFNVALAGPSNLQNAFSEYTEDGSELKRDSHVTLAERAHPGHGEDHYVGRLTNASLASQQMFDRKAQLLTTCCIGLQARFLTTKQKMGLRTRDGAFRYKGATQAERMAACRDACACYFTFTPFTSRQSWALQPELHNPPSARPGKDVYDAIRLPDLHAMVGFWTVGKILDTAAAKDGRRVRGGPSNAPSLLRVNVDVSFRNGLDQYDHAAAAKLKRQTDALPDARADAAERRRRDKVRAKLGRQARADQLRPSGRTVHGPAFGLAVLGPDAAAFCNAGERANLRAVALQKQKAAEAQQRAADAAEAKAEKAEKAAANAPPGSEGDTAREAVRRAQAEEEDALSKASRAAQEAEDAAKKAEKADVPDEGQGEAGGGEAYEDDFDPAGGDAKERAASRAKARAEEPSRCAIDGVRELESARTRAKIRREVEEDAAKARNRKNDLPETIEPFRAEFEQLFNEELAKNDDNGVSAIEEVRGVLAELGATMGDEPVVVEGVYVDADAEDPLFKRIEQRAEGVAEEAKERATEDGLSPTLKEKRKLEYETSQAYVNYLSQVGSLRSTDRNRTLRETYVDAVDDELEFRSASIAGLTGTPQGETLRRYVSVRTQKVVERIMYLYNTIRQIPTSEVWKNRVYAKLLARNEVRASTYLMLAAIVERACARPPPKPKGEATTDAAVYNVRIWAKGIKSAMRLARLQSMGYVHFGCAPDPAPAGATIAPVARKVPAARTSASAATPIVEAAAAAAAGRSGKSPARKRPVAASTGAPVTPGAPVRKRATPGGATSSTVTASVFESVLGSSPRPDAPPSPPPG